MNEAEPLLERLALYFDGSCQDNRNVTVDTPAGWGVVVVQGDSGLGRGDGEIIDEISGLVITDSTNEQWLDRSMTYSSGLFEFRWLLSQGGDSNVSIRGDSQYALKIATKEWRAKANQELASRVQNLWQEVASMRDLSSEHVRAHRGHRWNERADHLAWRACIGETPLPIQFWKPGMR